MTLDEFFEKLPRDGWKLDGQYIVRKRRVDFYNVCPITCLATPKRPAIEWNSVAIAIGLSIPTAKRIVRAADGVDGHFNRALRARLLAHCGLQEPQ